MKWLTKNNTFSSNIKKQIKTQNLQVDDYIVDWLDTINSIINTSHVYTSNEKLFKYLCEKWKESIQITKIMRYLSLIKDCDVALLDIISFDNFLKKKGKAKGIYSYYASVFGKDSQAYLVLSENYKQNSPYDPQHIAKKEKISIEKAKELSKQRKLNSSTSHEILVKKYGKELGTLKYENFKKNCSNTLEGFKLRFKDEKEAEIKYKEYCTKVSSNNTFEAYVEKHGEEKALQICKSKGRIYSDLIEKYGEEEAAQIIRNRQKGKAALTKASKSSYKYFLPLYELLTQTHDILKEDVCWGVGEDNEFLIIKNNKRYYYDFTILSLKIIIEFNGHKFHPKTPDDVNWRNPYVPELTAFQKYTEDRKKEQVAIEQGFRVITVFDNNLPSIENLIKDIYEN